MFSLRIDCVRRLALVIFLRERCFGVMVVCLLNASWKVQAFYLLLGLTRRIAFAEAMRNVVEPIVRRVAALGHRRSPQGRVPLECRATSPIAAI